MCGIFRPVLFSARIIIRPLDGDLNDFAYSGGRAGSYRVGPNIEWCRVELAVEINDGKKSSSRVRPISFFFFIYPFYYYYSRVNCRYVNGTACIVFHTLDIFTHTLGEYASDRRRRRSNTAFLDLFSFTHPSASHHCFTCPPKS